VTKEDRADNLPITNDPSSNFSRSDIDCECVIMLGEDVGASIE
jgi:hypothetical protein